MEFFQQIWKLQRSYLHIFKGKGSKLDLDKHRGVAIVNTFSKVFEKLASSRLIKFLNKHKFFDENQFGFLKGRSTNHAIVRIINFVTNALNKGEYAIGIFLDAMKAFDSVNHSILLKKLENAGILELSVVNKLYFVFLRRGCSTQYGQARIQWLGPSNHIMSIL